MAESRLLPLGRPLGLAMTAYKCDWCSRYADYVWRTPANEDVENGGQDERSYACLKHQPIFSEDFGDYDLQPYRPNIPN